MSIEAGMLSGAWLTGRVIAGGYFGIAGWRIFRDIPGISSFAASKKVPFPKAASLAAAVCLLAGGIGIGTGFHVRVAGGLVALFLLVANLTVHPGWRSEERESFLVNCGLLGLLLMVISGSR